MSEPSRVAATVRAAATILLSAVWPAGYRLLMRQPRERWLDPGSQRPEGR